MAIFIPVLTLLVVLFCDSPLHAGELTGDTREVWISARTNALGSGFIAGSGDIIRPYYGDFDAILNSLPSHTTIHLLPGIHFTKGYEFTRGDAALKAYQKVIGAGIDVTTVRRDRRFHPDTADNEGELWSAADGVEVSDLTIDANGSESDLQKNNAVGLRGSYCAVRRVKAIHTSGNLAKEQECFPIFVGDPVKVGNMISECEVSSIRGTYCTAIAVLGQGVVSHNRVFLPVMTNMAQGIFQGYQANGSRNALIDGNICDGGVSGFETDTLSETNLTIMNNAFRNVLCGVVLIKTGNWNLDGVAIRNNVIELAGGIPNRAGYGIVVRNEDRTGKVHCRNITISGNMVRALPAGRIDTHLMVGIEATSTVQTSLLNVRIEANTVDRLFQWNVNASGVSMANNSDLAGVPLHVRQVGPGSPGIAALQPLDGAIFVNSLTTSNLMLPNGRGFPGKELTIVNAKANGNLLIGAARGEKLVPNRAVLLMPNQSAHFISDGTGKWFAR
ncbi:MAG TPA: hypothetical protein VFD66_08590 [Verrucomicrobiae bacterium]|nr:hypothetical protein [Verrucomicrobiae bacterium]